MILADNDRIDHRTLFFILISLIIEYDMLTTPRTLILSAGAGAWLAWGFAILPILAAGFFLVRLGALFPGESFPSYSRKIVGPWLGTLLSIILVLYWLLNGGRILRSFADLIKIFLLFRTPIEVVILTFLLTAAYLARGGIEAIGRFSVLTVIISLPFASLLLLTTFKFWDTSNLLPLLEKGLKPVFFSGIKLLEGFEGLESLLVILAYVKKPQQSLSPVLAALVILMIVSLFVTMATPMVLGVGVTTRLAVPGVSLIQRAELPGRTLEHLGAIFANIWILIFYPTIVFFLYLPSVVLAEVSGLSQYKPFVLLLIPVFYLISILPANQLEVMGMIKFMTPINLGIIGLLPVTLYLIARIRGYKPGGERSGDSD